MTSITPGTSGTLKAIKAESALVEIVTFLKNSEKNTNLNPNKRNYVTVDFNLNTGSVSISFNIPATPIITSNGSIEIVTSEYLTNLNFISGTNGTLKSSTAAASLIEIASFIQNKEADTTANTSGNNYINFNYDGDNNLFSGSATIPFTVSIDSSGKPVIEVTEYLL